MKDFKDEMKDFKKIAVESGEKCRLCGEAMMIKWSKNGQFIGCSGFPECRNTQPMPGEESEAEAKETANLTPCEKCGAPMMLKHGRFGKFVSCTKYPDCTNTRALSTGIKCPSEGCEGELVARRSKKGRPFFGCSRFPDCEYITNKKPEEPKEEVKEEDEEVPEETKSN